VTLFRVVGEGELGDILRFGDYGLSPNFSGKYFALTEEGARAFMASGFNAGRRMVLTSISVSASFLARGSIFPDVGGAGEPVHFADEVPPDLYAASELPRLLDARWIKALGGGQ
jgi:hypothetical protein